MGTTIIHMAGSIVRGLFFAILLFFRPFVTGVLSFLGGLCLLGFIGTLILDRSQGTALFGLFSFGITAVGLAFCYNWIVMLLAPAGFTMLLED